MKLKKHPITWIPTVYFAMGLPFVALAQASSLMFKNLGISDTQITFWTSLLILPFSLKPLWSPILEMFRTKKTICCSYSVCNRNFIRIGSIFVTTSRFFSNMP